MDINGTSSTLNMSSNATSEISSLASFLGRAAYEAHIMRPLLPTYVHLIASALFPIWIASHASLVRPWSAAKPKAKPDASEADDEETEEKIQKIESLSAFDAVLFPVLAGVALTGLYFLLKNLQDPAWLNWAMNIYFAQMGLFFAYKFLTDAFAFIRNIAFPRYYTWKGALWKVDEDDRRYIPQNEHAGSRYGHTSPLPGLLRVIPLPGFLQRGLWSFRQTIFQQAIVTLHLQRHLTIRANPTILDVSAFFLAAALSYVHAFVAKPWQLTNFFGLSFCYGSLQMTSPSTAGIGSLLLGGLFLYDIYMVFYTPMMVHVATNLDVPIKMLFPRPDGCVYPTGAEEGSLEMEEYLKCLGKKRAMAMLGLGDIVVPGLIIAFALQFDLWRHYLKLQKTAPKPDSGSDTEAGDSQMVIKEPYRPATGGWGDRLWVSSAYLRPTALRAKSFKKTYFHATIVGYILGMCATVGVMQVAKHAQPALLYLVPGVLGGLWGTALMKGEIKLLWNYTEDEVKEPKKKAKEIGVAKKDGEETQQETSASDDSRALMESDVPEAPTDNGQREGKDGPADEEDHDEIDKLKPEVREEMKFVREHAVYFSIKLPKSNKKASKNEQSKTGEATNPEPDDNSAKAIESPSSPSPTKETGNKDVIDDTDDDVDDDEIIIYNATPAPAISKRVLRSSGAADVLKGVDEEATRGAKRRRKA